MSAAVIPAARCNARHAVDTACPDPDCYRYAPPPLGAVVAAARASKGWTQHELAKQVARALQHAEPDAAIGGQYVSDIEGGRRSLSLGRLRVFADVLGVSIDRLCGREQRPDGKRYPLVSWEVGA